MVFMKDRETNDKTHSNSEAEIQDIHEIKTIDIAEKLETNLDHGLSQTEAKNRLNQYGFNEVPETEPSSISIFLRKFWGLTAWMLEAVIILSLILQKYFDVAVVAILLVLNSILGFAEERRASTAVEALKEKLQINARVLRDRIWNLIPAKELVPGDVVRVRTGDFVPADLKIATGQLEVDQSSLTGESITKEKTENDSLYSGSTIRRGEATGIVVLTGNKTYFGKTTQLVQIARPKMHIELVVSQVVKWLALIVIIMLVAAIIISVAKGLNMLELLPLILVLLLSAVPVALPAMFTLSMALGAFDLSKSGVLVTRLSASEDAAIMSVLCTDKTGTLTMNQLSIAKIIPMNNFKDQDVILYGALASQEADQDPIDLAFISHSKQTKVPIDKYIQKRFVPFDPLTRRTSATVEKLGEEFEVTKGSVEIIADFCKLDEQELGKMRIQVESLAQKGYRTLAVATNNGFADPKIVGLAALYDAPRPDSRQMINNLKDLGVSVKMLTGDALPVAQETAKNVGLGENIIRISDFRKTLKGNTAIAAKLFEKSDGFAEIYPEDKYVIVKNFQSISHVVGMTGDGVNDAPALRQAEVGIAVNNATDVAKGAASAVLTKEGLSGIVDLIMVGRSIFERVTTWILNKIVTTAMIVPFVVFSFFITGHFVVSALVMILLLFMTDFVKLALSTDNVKLPRQPEKWDIPNLVKVAFALAGVSIVELLGMLYIGFVYMGFDAQNSDVYTLTFVMLFYSAIFLLLNVRERGHFWKSAPSKPLTLAIFADVIIGILIATSGVADLPAISIWITLITIGYFAVFSLIINDLIKHVLVEKIGLRW
jgi:H+-transporting ATPase